MEVSGRWVEADPESAGLIRKERPGWAIGFTVLGTTAMVVSWFLDWIEAAAMEHHEHTASTGMPWTVHRDDADIFAAVETIREITGPAPDAIEPGGLTQLFFPWLAILLTVVCVLTATVAAIGLRRAALTNAIRIIAVSTAVIAAVLCLLTHVQLGVFSENAERGQAPPVGYSSSWVNVSDGVGIVVWLAGALCLAIAGALGPRITHQLPPGTAVSTGSAGGPGVPQPTLRRSTQGVAVVLTALGALLAFAGYVFLPWAEEVIFADIGEAVREHGIADLPVSEAYFTVLGWVFLAAMTGVSVVVALGVRPIGVNPAIARPICTAVASCSLFVHCWVIIEAELRLSAGMATVALGLALGTLGAVLPLRRSARVLFPAPAPARPAQDRDSGI